MPVKDKVFGLILIMEFLLTVLYALYMMTSALFKRKSQIKYPRKNYENLIKEFDVKIDYKHFKRISIISLVLILIYYNIVITGFLLSYRPNFSFKVSTINTYAILAVYIIQTTASAIFAHGYVGCVFMIYQRICGVAEKLEKIIQREKNKIKAG